MAARAKNMVITVAQNICPGGIHLGTNVPFPKDRREGNDTDAETSGTRCEPSLQRILISATRRGINDQCTRDERKLLEEIASSIVGCGLGNDDWDTG